LFHVSIQYLFYHATFLFLGGSEDDVPTFPTEFELDPDILKTYNERTAIVIKKNTHFKLKKKKHNHTSN